MSNTTTTDSTTTLTTRPVALHIPADTASGVHSLSTFIHTFSQAQVGDVIAQQRGKAGRASYTIRKSDTGSFEVEAVAAAKDTTVLVNDSKTVVHKKTLQVVKDEPVGVKKWLLKARDNVIYSVFSVVLLLLLILLIIRKLTK